MFTNECGHPGVSCIVLSLTSNIFALEYKLVLIDGLLNVSIAFKVLFFLVFLDLDETECLGGFNRFVMERYIRN